MEIILSNLPESVLKKIPLSIRTFKDVYDISELPSREREIIEDYLEKTPNVEYDSAYDIQPLISKYADFNVINTPSELILEYLKNYFYTLPGEYPFDPTFGCNLKIHLQTRDTQLRKLLIRSEVDNIIDVLSNELNTKIEVSGINIVPINKATHSEFNIEISLKINDTGPFKIGLKEFN